MACFEAVRSVLVVVTGVLRVLVAVVHIIDVVIVLHGFVAARGAVLVFVGGVLSDGLVLVVVVIVQGMMVDAVHVVDVVIMLHGFVPAIGAVLVLGDGVLGVRLDGAHGVAFRYFGLRARVRVAHLGIFSRPHP